MAFQEVLDALTGFAADLGGSPHFSEGAVELRGKLTRQELSHGHTDYEHAALTILGFGRLRQLRGQILHLNNGGHYLSNPGTQLLERSCGFTMHADRTGAVACLKEGPELLLAAFMAAASSGRPGLSDFFRL